MIIPLLFVYWLIGQCMNNIHETGPSENQKRPISNNYLNYVVLILSRRWMITTCIRVSYINISHCKPRSSSKTRHVYHKAPVHNNHNHNYKTWSTSKEALAYAHNHFSTDKEHIETEFFILVKWTLDCFRAKNRNYMRDTSNTISSKWSRINIFGCGALSW